MEQWIKNVALVTGASSGIGAAICRELVKHDITVLGCARDVGKVQDIAKNLQASGSTGTLHPYQCDLKNEQEILGMFKHIRKEFGGVDVCINNAGFATNTSLTSGDFEEWKAMLEVNVMALCICTRESIRQMEERHKEGLIVHVGCIMGHKVPDLQYLQDVPDFGFHYGTKFMLRALAESLRHELKRRNLNIRVAAVSPGAVHTEFFARGFDKKAADDFYRDYPCLKPRDVSEAILYIMNMPSRINVQDVMVQPTDYSI